MCVSYAISLIHLIYFSFRLAWYYFGPRGLGEMPPHPTLSAFGRASTLSLGSIAFGSLIVAILELVRMILHAARSTGKGENNRGVYPP